MSARAVFASKGTTLRSCSECTCRSTNCEQSEIDERATTIATNTPFGAPEREYRNAGNGNLVRLTGFNQNTQEADRETDPNVLVGNLVTSFGSELFIPDINDFRPIAEQFRPIAVSAVNLLIALVNADSPDLPPIAFVA